MTSYLVTIVSYTIFLTVYEIFTNQIICKSLPLKIKVKLNNVKNWSNAIWLEMFDFILMILQNVNIRQYIFAQMVTHT